jgi:hypothetical protein
MNALCLLVALPLAADVHTSWSLKKILADHAKESGETAVNDAINTLIASGEVEEGGQKKEQVRYSDEKGYCRHSGKPCETDSLKQKKLDSENAEVCCMLKQRGCASVHLWNENGDVNGELNEIGCLPEHTDKIILAEDQYHFQEHIRQWKTHHVYVFSVYKEWEHYSLAEKNNMREIIDDYKKDFDVVIYNKYKNEEDGDAWCKDEYPSLCE